jgi:hypothetical protein
LLEGRSVRALLFFLPQSNFTIGRLAAVQIMGMGTCSSSAAKHGSFLKELFIEERLAVLF